MYLPIDYNCFVNQLYHKTKIIYKERVTCKKKHGDFNFTLQSRESDFSQYRARISPDLVSPGYLGPGLNLLVGFQHSLLYIQIYNCQNRFIKKNKTVKHLHRFFLTPTATYILHKKNDTVNMKYIKAG
jgi:hypothetical protein